MPAHRIDVALASCMQLPEPDPDAEPLVSALRVRGLEVVTAAWDGDDFDWSSAAMVLLRSTWNYYLDRPGFLRWIDAVAGVAELHNPAELVRWNTDKHYLADLRGHGVATVPTAHIDRGSDCDLDALCEERGWHRVVVKPAVSASSFETHTMRAGEVDALLFARLLAARDMMVQPFVDSVRDYGERSVVMIDGEATHSVRKSPRFGGESESVTGPMPIAADERALAEAALAATRDIVGCEQPLYGRVDMARDAGGDAMVMELELTEPSLFFAQGPEALAAMVDRIAELARH